MTGPRWATRAFALLIAAAAGAGGCADYVGDDVRAGEATIPAGAEDLYVDGTTTTTAPPAPADPRSLDVGACFDDVADVAGEQPVDVSAVEGGSVVVPRSCAGEHRYELYARGELAGTEAIWPGSEPLAEQADTFCAERFDAFVGTAWSGSTLDYVAQIPDEARWNAGDRLVSCVLFDLGLVPLEGTMSGTGR